MEQGRRCGEGVRGQVGVRWLWLLLLPLLRLTAPGLSLRSHTPPSLLLLLFCHLWAVFHRRQWLEDACSALSVSQGCGGATRSIIYGEGHRAALLEGKFSLGSLDSPGSLPAAITLEL